MARALIAAAALLAVAAPGAGAATSYCTPSGDYCKSTYKRSGVRYIELRTAALYAPPPSYRLCVRDPRGEETCRTFALRENKHGVWVSRVRWSRHFPTDGGPGRYRVRWRDDGVTYGPPLHFRRR